MEYETDEAKALIKKMLKDEDDEVKVNAVIALYNIEGEDILNEIINDSQYSQVCKEEAQNILNNEQDYE